MIWPTFKGYWQSAWQSFRHDIARLDAAARPMLAVTVVLGVARGLVPIVVLITVFNLVNALIGARGVGVITSELVQTLWSAAGVWAGSLVVIYSHMRLRGVMAKVAQQVAIIVFLVSSFICTFLVGPFRCLLLVVTFLASEVWSTDRRVALLLLAVAVGIGVSIIMTVLSILLARSFTVGGFLLFAGITTTLLTWMMLRRMQTVK